MGPDSKKTGRKRSRHETMDKVKQGDKRSRHGKMKAHSQAKTLTNATPQEDNKSDYSLTQVNNTEHGNEYMRSLWDCDGDLGEMGLDIQLLISEYGDFSDLFEDDDLPIGEPPEEPKMQAPLVSERDCGSKRSGLKNLKDDSNQMLMQVPTIQSSSMNLKDDSNQMLMQVPTIQSSSMNLKKSSNQKMLVQDPPVAAQDIGTIKSSAMNLKDASYRSCQQRQLFSPKDSVTIKSSSVNLTNFSDQMLMQSSLNFPTDYGSISNSSLDLTNVPVPIFQSPCFTHFQNSEQPAPSATENLLSSNQQATYTSVGFVPTIHDMDLTCFSDQLLKQNPQYFAPGYGSRSSSLFDLTTIPAPIFQSPSFPHFQNSKHPAASGPDNLLSSNQQATYNGAGFVPTIHDSDLTYFSNQSLMQNPQYFSPNYGGISGNMSGLTKVMGQTFQSPGFCHFQNSGQLTASAPGNFINNNQQAAYNTVRLAPTVHMPLSSNGHEIIDVEEYSANMERMRIMNSIQQQAMSWILRS